MKIYLKTPISYYGGKQTMLRHILPLIPQDANTYCEPFFGGGAVFFAKEPHPVEIVNDLNSELINFFRVLQLQYDKLYKKIISTPHSRDLHRDAHTIYNNAHLFDEVERAWALWVLTNQGFGSSIGRGWAYGNKTNTCEKKVMNSRNRMCEAYKQRLNTVQIECNDALKVIRHRDTKDSFFYCDPPYFNSNCSHYDGYTEKDFINLLDTLASIEGKFLLSSYPSPILSDYTKRNKWSTSKVEKIISAAKPKDGKREKKKIEVLTWNYCV